MAACRGRSLSTSGVLGTLNGGEFAAADCERLGIMLKLESRIIKNIKSSRHGQVENMLMDIIDHWVLNSEPSWAKLAVAIENMGGYGNLANTLYKKSQEVNEESVQVQQESSNSSASLVSEEGTFNFIGKDVCDKVSKLPITTLNTKQVIFQLEEEFGMLIRKICTFIISNEETTSSFCENIEYILPQRLKGLKRHIKVIRTNIDDVSDFFDGLDYIWTFVDYELLDFIINKWGPNELINEMENYVKRVNYFCEQTTICELIEHWKPRICEDKIPDELMKGIMRFPWDPMSTKIGELKLVQKVVQKACPQELAMTAYCILHKVQSSSVAVTWLFWTKNVPYIIEKYFIVAKELYAHFQIISFVINNVYLYSEQIPYDNRGLQFVSELKEFPSNSDLTEGVDIMGTVKTELSSSTVLDNIMLECHVSDNSYLIANDDENLKLTSIGSLKHWMNRWLKQNNLVYITWIGNLEKMNDDSNVKNIIRKYSQQMMYDSRESAHVTGQLVFLQLENTGPRDTEASDEIFWIFLKLSLKEDTQTDVFSPQIRAVKKRLLQLFSRGKIDTKGSTEANPIGERDNKYVFYQQSEVSFEWVHVRILVEGHKCKRSEVQSEEKYMKKYKQGKELEDSQSELQETQDSAKAKEDSLNELEKGHDLGKTETDFIQHLELEDFITWCELAESQDQGETEAYVKDSIRIEEMMDVVIWNELAESQDQGETESYIKDSIRVEELMDTIAWSELTKSQDQGETESYSRRVTQLEHDTVSIQLAETQEPGEIELDEDWKQYEQYLRISLDGTDR